MTHDELLAKARNELNSLPLSKIGAVPEDFVEAGIFETAAVAVRFSCKNREETYELAFNPENGEYVCTLYQLEHPRGKWKTLNNEELLGHARNVLNSILNHPLFRIGIEPEEFTEAKILEGANVIVRFKCKDRNDMIELMLNSKTGDCVSGAHIPKYKPAKSG
jgi:hypothetical protein